MIGVAEPLSRGAVGLARQARNDCIHDSAPRASVEGGEVRPDRRVIQAPGRHKRDQLACGIGFPLDVANRASIESCSESKIVHSDAGAEGEDAHGTCSHIHATPANITTTSTIAAG